MLYCHLFCKNSPYKSQGGGGGQEIYTVQKVFTTKLKTLFEKKTLNGKLQTHFNGNVNFFHCA